MLTVIIFILLGFILLLKGADFLVDGSSALAAKMSISEIVIGLTIVAFGTSSPELLVNIFASLKDQPNVAFGNIVGSNIVNILLILGVSGIIYPIQIEKNTVWREIPFSLLAVFALFLMCNDMYFNNTENFLSRGDGLVFLLFFIIFLTYSFGIPKVESRDKPEIKELSNLKIILLIVGGLVGLIFGGKLVVENTVYLARRLMVSEKLIGLTIVSIGTSLPELLTSTVAAYKKKSDIAIGNIVGSNIFNIFFILGISAVIKPLPFQSVLNVDLIVLIMVSLILFLTMFTGKKHSLDRWEAGLLVLLYILYTVYLVIRK